jgi:DnaK suppressor protein
VCNKPREALARNLRHADLCEQEETMKRKDLVSLSNELRRQRAALLKTVVDAEADLASIAEERESELEERAQEERAARLYARLDERGKREIESIDAALRRIADGSYGVCTDCEAAIAPGRLRALPSTLYCVACATEHERGGRTEAGELEAPRGGALPADLSLLSDRELEETLREMVKEDGRVDTDELRLVARRGVVYVDGAVPSEGERQVLLKLLTDVAGVREILDRVQVSSLLWARADRDRQREESVDLWRPEPPQTDDIVENMEDGIEYSAPSEPVMDED